MHKEPTTEFLSNPSNIKIIVTLEFFFASRS